MSDGIAKGARDTACSQPFLETDLIRHVRKIARQAESQKHTNSTPQNWSMGVQSPLDIVKPEGHLRALLLRGAVLVAPRLLSLQFATTME